MKFPSADSIEPHLRVVDFVPGKGIIGHTLDCPFCLETDWKAVKPRLHKHSLRRVEQKGSGSPLEGSRQASKWKRAATGKDRAVSCTLLAEIRLRFGEGVPWPGCDPEGYWTVTSTEICEWKEVKMKLVRILKNIRGLKEIGEKIYFHIKLRTNI